jgi:hypothetical protein
MWELILKHVFIFGAMTSVTILLPGIMMGMNHSLKHVYGYSFDFLFGYSKKQVMGVLPMSILGAGICGIIAGLFGLEFVYFKHISEIEFDTIATPISIGGVFGLLNVSFVNGFRWFVGEEIIKRYIRWAYRVASWITGGIVGWLFGNLLLGVLAGVLIDKSVGVLVYGYAMMAFPIVVRTTMPYFILRRFSTIICQNCLRYTQPLKSHYEYGIRYCELCEQAVEWAKDPGKVVLTFGDLSLKLNGRVFMLSNPDFEQKDHRIDVSEVYIDTKTCDRRLFERFITYIINYPPKDGLQSVQIFYQGELDALGDNLKNTLLNNFEQVKHI